MGKPVAKQGDQINGVDTHVVMVPSAGGPVPTPLPHPFTGIIDSNCSPNINIQGMPAATLGSSATNLPPHLPTPPGITFQIPPTNRGVIVAGSSTVMFNHKPAARAGDAAQTCADPVPNLSARVVAAGTVLVGG